MLRRLHALPETISPTTRRRGAFETTRRRPFIRRSRFESVAGFPDGQDMTRLGWIVLQFPPQLRDVNVHGPRHDLDAMTPDLAKQLYPGGIGTTTPHKRQQEVELLRAECNRHAFL